MLIMGLILASMFATVEATPQDGRNAVALLVVSAIFMS
jgi:hypothetical protein